MTSASTHGPAALLAQRQLGRAAAFKTDSAAPPERGTRTRLMAGAVPWLPGPGEVQYINQRPSGLKRGSQTRADPTPRACGAGRSSGCRNTWPARSETNNTDRESRVQSAGRSWRRSRVSRRVPDSRAPPASSRAT